VTVMGGGRQQRERGHSRFLWHGKLPAHFFDRELKDEL
jgi:hypothetical protein